MKTLHTSGPWISDGGNDKGQRCISHLTENGVVFIAGVEIPIHDTDNLTRAQAEANAHLIVTSPLLLSEMLRYLPILERAEQNPEVWEYLTSGGSGIATLNGYRMAITKATGGHVQERMSGALPKGI